MSYKDSLYLHNKLHISVSCFFVLESCPIWRESILIKKVMLKLRIVFGDLFAFLLIAQSSLSYDGYNLLRIEMWLKQHCNNIRFFTGHFILCSSRSSLFYTSVLSRVPKLHDSNEVLWNRNRKWNCIYRKSFSLFWFQLYSLHGLYSFMNEILCALLDANHNWTYFYNRFPISNM